jgi:predicted  nucleic acid-binding Zn-ribbon protein
LDILDLEEIIETTKAAVGDENKSDLSACESRVLELKATYEGTIAALQASALKASAYEKGLEYDEEVASHFVKKYKEIEESKRREVDMLRDSYERRIKELEETHEAERLNFELQKSALKELADNVVEPEEAGDLMTELSEANEQESKAEKRWENLEKVQQRLGKLQREIDLTEKMMGERRKFYEAKEAHDQEIRQLADEKASLEAQNAMLVARVDELETARTLDNASSEGVTNSWVKEKFQYSDSRYVWYTQRRILDTHLNRLENEKEESDAELARLKEENTRLQEVVKVLEKKEKEAAVVDSVNIIETGMKKRAKTFEKLMRDGTTGGDASAPEADVDAEAVELYAYRKVIENSIDSIDESVADLVNLMLTIRSNMQDQAGQEATEGHATDPIHEAMLAADPVFRMVEDKALDISARIRLVQDEAEGFWKGKATPPTPLQLVRAVKAKDAQIEKLEAKYKTSELPSPFWSR